MQRSSTAGGGDDQIPDSVQLTLEECGAGFEPAHGGLGMPRPFLAGPHMCFRLAVALIVVLGLTGRLDASTAYALGQILLP